MKPTYKPEFGGTLLCFIATLFGFASLQGKGEFTISLNPIASWVLLIGGSYVLVMNTFTIIQDFIKRTRSKKDAKTHKNNPQ